MATNLFVTADELICIIEEGPLTPEHEVGGEDGMIESEGRRGVRISSICAGDPKNWPVILPD